MRAAISLALALSLVAAQARCEDKVRAFMNGNMLYAACKADADVFTCINYIDGVVDAEHFRNSLGMGRVFCDPADVTAGQLQDIVVNYYAAKPEARSYAAAGQIILAMMAVFPCADRSPTKKPAAP